MCIFCKIIEGTVKSDILYDDENFIIIPDIHPRAKLHFLLIPKAHYATLADMNAEQSEKLASALYKLPVIAKKLGLKNGYRLIINQGNDANQTVQHLHIHILGGQRLTDF